MAEPESRLSAAMEQRRVQLRMTWVDVAKKAGLSIAGLSAIRRGERNPTSVTRASIEDALQWMPGSVDAVLAGGEVTPAAAPQADRMRSDDDLDAVEALLEQALAELNRLKREREKPA